MTDQQVIDAETDAVLELVAMNIALRARVAELETELRRVLEFWNAD